MIDCSLLTKLLLIFPHANSLPSYIIQEKSGSNFISTRFKKTKVISQELKLYQSELTPSERTKLEQVPGIRIQKDHPLQLRTNDPNWPLQWSMGQVPGIDISAAWARTTRGTDALGTRIVVGVVDTGIDINHPDLKGNIWVNTSEIPANGIDDDGNGFIDDVNGWNFFSDAPKIIVHGTQVAGIIGAKANNQKHIAGISPNVKIMDLAGGSSRTSVAFSALNYALVQKKRFLKSTGKTGANVVALNLSFGIDFADCRSEEYFAWNEIFNQLGAVGILSVVATTNNFINVDETGDIPSTCTSEYVIAVTNIDSSGKINRFLGGYGPKHIDLGAPGTDIYSLAPGNQSQTSSGTSDAAPMVAATIALMYAAASEDWINQSRKQPAEYALKIKATLLKNITPLKDLSEKTVSGGSLNSGRATNGMK